MRCGMTKVLRAPTGNAAQVTYAQTLGTAVCLSSSSKESALQRLDAPRVWGKETACGAATAVCLAKATAKARGVRSSTACFRPTATARPVLAVRSVSIPHARRVLRTPTVAGVQARKSVCWAHTSPLWRSCAPRAGLWVHTRSAVAIRTCGWWV